MNWAVALSKTYDLACEKGEPVLPLFHSTLNAQVEAVLSEDGNFKSASIVDKEDAVTLLPVTEDSGARSSDVAPMPFADKLAYVAGDYAQYTGESNTSKYHAYLGQLKAWKDSDFSHPAINAVYAYLSKGHLMQDLVEAGVLQVDETGKLDKKKLNNVEQSSFLVRYVIDYNDPAKERSTWKDKTLSDMYEAYSLDLISKADKQLCYATGEMTKATYKHPVKIRHAADSARMISANDESGYTYRGRFTTKTEAISIGYLTSQKMHNGLKWLIATQKCRLDTMNIVVWASELQDIPRITDPWFRIDEDCEPFKTLSDYEMWLKDKFDEYRKNVNPETRVMILAIDSCSPGRVPISYYDEIPANEYLDHLYTWYKNSAWFGYHQKEKTMTIKAYSPYDYIRAAFGYEVKTGLTYETSNGYPVAARQIMNLLPCMTRGVEIPEYMEDKLLKNASNVDFYQKRFSNYVVMNALCSYMRLRSKGEVQMGYDPQEKDRSYLYGCLLAFADKVELDTYPMKDRNKIVTNARRYWTAFSRCPYQTWQVIEERLRPFLDKHPYRSWAEKQLQEIMSKFTPETFTDDTELDAMYQLGYHHYTEYLYNWYKNNTDENEEEDF